MKKESYGGILCDIGSHQIEQYLYFADVKSAKVEYSRVANYNHPDYPGLEDFGDAMLTGDNRATNYFRWTGLHRTVCLPGETEERLSLERMDI